MYEKGDFHMHTIASDGDLTSTEVVRLAKERGVDILAITDHNTVDAIEEAKIAGDKYGVRIVVGVELSTRYYGKKVHLLGYFKDEAYNDKELKLMLNLVRTHNMNELEKKFKDRVVVNKDNEKNRITVKTGINLLKFFGGKVVLAHPVKISSKYIEEILLMDFDGIEAKYFKNSPEDTIYFKEIANRRCCFYTAGSDFHTNIRVDRRHGVIGDVYLDKDELQRFLFNL